MRKWIIKLLERWALSRLNDTPGVEICSTVKILSRKVIMRPQCSLKIGAECVVESSLIFEKAGASILIGDHTFIGNSIIASAQQIEIGNDVLISWGCNIVDHNSHAIGWTQRQQDVRDWYNGRKDWSHVAMAPVKICDKVWIGLNVILLKGVTVGEGAVVAAGSVVTKDVPPWTVVAGNPAKVIREIALESR